MVGSSFSPTLFSNGLVRVPVRMADGRICSKPWLAATFSMDLKYWAACQQTIHIIMRANRHREIKSLP